MHPTVLIALLVIGIVAFLMRPRPTFVVDIKDSKAVVRSGKVPASFLRDCEAILSLYEISEGRIKAKAAGSRVLFSFSSSIPHQYHQNFRNAWQLHR